ncbi:methyltransferase [Aneurinibacillus migulanus]|uniref:class I SAM-dependent methyltransferase n=1 Tax=Aneurinibacillus migulanus TaxID=47500 RepID=UPI0005BAE972|nr:class I SAM-dependent methyltransferase [Aneurinibacillus migulanus]KIV57387.1 methyltransferase [Aneurinibacillus migulanus]KPD07952.1 methyltransferase [Aneurinibacillus migulanus]MCP1358053.1 class I SAM-dependent methyltransferase [Aneurinibacillus migulanus]CEH28740.1 Uncharacterized protein BN1090_A2_01162 [Aneurinibacillus migulanus]
MYIWSLEEYDDPELYDIENTGIEELAFLRMWSDKLGIKDKPIVDLACGTGRITIPFAEQGYNLIGIDIHEGMLNQAKSKTPETMSIRWLHQDCLHMQVDVPVPLAYMVGHAFQHFLTNQHQNKFLQTLRNVLTKDGVFIFNTRFPSIEELLQPSEEVFWKSITDSQNRRCDIYTKMLFDMIKQVQSYVTIRRFYENEKMIEEKETKIDLRYTFPQELERVLLMNGFKVLHIYDGWREKMLSKDCYTMVVVCQKEQGYINYT